MATMTLILRSNPETGQQELLIKRDGDGDELPIEHEQAHSELLRKMLGSLPAGVGVERLDECGQVAAPVSQSEAERQSIGNAS